MVLRTAVATVFVCVQVLNPSYALSQEVSKYAKECIAISDLSRTDMAPQLVRSMRDCIDKSRFPEAIQLFFAYSVYGNYDVKRVLSDRQNDAIVDLNNWMLSDYPRPIIAELRFFADAMRKKENEFYSQTCAALLAVGPPEYEPFYLIGRGIEQELDGPEWRVAGFDAQSNWQAELSVNRCPTD